MPSLHIEATRLLIARAAVLVTLCWTSAHAQSASTDAPTGDGRLPVYVNAARLSAASGERIAAVAKGRVGAIIDAAGGTAIDFNALMVVVPTLALLSEERMERVVPAMTSVRVQLTLTATLANKVAPNGTVVRTLSGLGPDKEAAYVNALEGLDPNDTELAAYFARLQSSVVTAFERDCDAVLSQARMQAMEGEGVNGFVVLDGIPMGAARCHARAEQVMGELVQIRQERRCARVLEATRKEISSGRPMAAMGALIGVKLLPPPCLRSSLPLANDIQAQARQLVDPEKSSLLDRVSSFRSETSQRLTEEVRKPTATLASRVALARRVARTGSALW